MESRSILDKYGRPRYSEHPALDQHADILLKAYLKQVQFESGLLRRRTIELAQLWEARNPSQPREAHTLQLTAALREVERAADQLSETVSPLFTFLRPALKGLRRSFKTDSREPRVETLVLQGNQALTSINGYFFDRAPVVSVWDLQQGDMLGSLMKIKCIAQNLRRRIGEH